MRTQNTQSIIALGLKHVQKKKNKYAERLEAVALRVVPFIYVDLDQ